MADQRQRNDDPLLAAHGEERDEDDERSDAGPPVEQMATTYGSSLIRSQDQADAIADAGSPPTGPAGGDGGNPGGAADSTPAERPAQKVVNPDNG
jgi:hypothetical protein